MTEIRKKYPDKVPIHISFDSTKITINKHKFLVPNEFTMGQFIHILRKRMILQPEQAIFLFINGELPSSNAILSDLYKRYKSEDGMLKMICAFENTFG
jgi:GABA(A) receptor-associated protein